MTACATQTKIVPTKRKLCPPKRELCPKDLNRLGATGVQIEAKDTQIGVCRPRIREQELLFRNFCELTPDFI